jgi:hypothetical protein
VTPAELQAAMDAYRPMRFLPWWAISTLRPSMPPQQPSAPLSGDLVPVGCAPDTDVVVVSESLTAPQKVEDAHGVARGVTIQLDIAIWRGRLFWRLAVKAAVRFFRP